MSAVMEVVMKIRDTGERLTDSAIAAAIIGEWDEKLIDEFCRLFGEPCRNGCERCAAMVLGCVTNIRENLVRAMIVSPETGSQAVH